MNLSYDSRISMSQTNNEMSNNHQKLINAKHKKRKRDKKDVKSIVFHQRWKNTKKRKSKRKRKRNKEMDDETLTFETHIFCKLNQNEEMKQDLINDLNLVTDNDEILVKKANKDKNAIDQIFIQFRKMKKPKRTKWVDNIQNIEAHLKKQHHRYKDRYSILTGFTKNYKMPQRKKQKLK